MKALPSIERDLHGLPKLNLRTLQQTYQRLYGKAAPRAVPRVLLAQAVAARLRQLLLNRLRAKVQQALVAVDAIDTILTTNSAHTELVAEWGGRVHLVDLVDGGVISQGCHYGSLSAVAKRITGRKVSGPELFGLVPGKGQGHARD